MALRSEKTRSALAEFGVMANILRYLIVKEVFWYEVPRTLRGPAVGIRRLYLPSGVMNQVSDTKNYRVVKA